MAASRMLMALAIAAIMVVEFAMAANYTVGDSDGWELGINFESWASSKKFAVGDVLNYEYSPNHDVLEVTEPDFISCASSNPIKKHTGGSTAITLSTPGKRYFICGVIGHCDSGMKVEINTLAAASSPPPPSTETPPAVPETPPASPPEVTPSSPPPTSSPAAPTSPPVSPPKAATKPPAKSPSAPPPGSDVSPPAPPIEPSSPSPAPESPIPPFPFDRPLNPTGAPTTPVKPPPPPSSAYKCSLGVHLSIGLSFVVIMLLAL